MKRNSWEDSPRRLKLAAVSFDVVTVLRHLTVENSAEKERRVAKSAAVIGTPKPSPLLEDWCGAGDENRTRVLSLGSCKGSVDVQYITTDQGGSFHHLRFNESWRRAYCGHKDRRVTSTTLTN